MRDFVATVLWAAGHPRLVDDARLRVCLVNGLAARWGATAYGARSPHSKTVWFTLSAASAVHPSI
ncbi:hypothetical protein AADR41_22625 [Streptomyces sp. CLV115]|uniref:hypothetical protein n=1 Tax=Streptomyces sp. CLV115 TaxID=3138502 RepID=UPI00313BBA23